MTLYIRQNGNHYKFFERNSKAEILQAYWSSTWKMGVYSKICDHDNLALATISLKRNAPYWRMNNRLYRIQIDEADLDIEVKAVNAYNGHWTFQIIDDRYDFYHHDEHKKSLFKNHSQVAKYDKGVVHQWDDESAFLIANNDENRLLLLAMFLMFDMGQIRTGDMLIDPLRLARGVREYRNWQPVR